VYKSNALTIRRGGSLLCLLGGSAGAAMVAMCLASREPGPSDKAFSRQHTIDAVFIRLPTTFQRASERVHDRSQQR
jgi:hypothetical protein